MAVDTEAPIVALSAVIREADARDRMHADLEGYLREHGVANDDLAQMLEVGAERILVYRQLVHNRMRKAIRGFIPRSLARRGQSEFAADFAAFMHERAASSPYLRDVPAEFVDWVATRWKTDDEVPDFLHDLARHELLAADVRNDPRGGEAPTQLPLMLDRPLRFDGAARRMTYAFAVHRLPEDTDDRSEPERVRTELLVYRDAKHKVRYLELTLFAAAVLDELLLRHTSVQAGLTRACEALGEPLDDDKLAAAARLLADLAERGVMLGAEPS